MKPVSHRIDRLEVTFDEPNLVSQAGLLLVGTLVARLRLEELINRLVDLGRRVGGANPGAKVLTLVHALIVGATHIDHVNVLRTGDTADVLPHAVMAPSTIGTFLRAFSFGHVRQLEAVAAEAVARAWAAGLGPGKKRLVMDLDSTITEVEGKKKQGASYGYTRVLGYHPLLASRSDTGELLAARLRGGSANTSRGVRRFIEELVARVRRAGATGELVLRMDSGFWSKATIATLNRLDVRYSMTIRTGSSAVCAAIAAIDESAWVGIGYTPDGQAQVAETIYQDRRLIVRRTRLTDVAQARLWPDWRHHGFLTDLTGPAVEVDAFHRAHARVELVIKDAKEGSGLVHMPSGLFAANAAWLACAVLAHNLVRWTALSGGIVETDHLTVARTMRTRFLQVPARLVNHAGRWKLRCPERWPWAESWTEALSKLRTIHYCASG